MKRENLFQKGAKVVAFLLLGTLSLTSCSQDDDSSASVEEAEAVEAVENSLAMDTGGMAKSMETAVVYGEDENLYTARPNLDCGQSYSGSYTENFSSTNYFYNYTAACDYQLICDANGNPQSLNYNAHRTGDYETPRMASDDEAVASWSISALDPSNENTLFNGSYIRTGTQISKVRNQNTFSSTLTYALDNIAVNKTTHKIVSGSATVAFSGVSATGNQYNYNGTITFNGDATATLVINGNTYTINL